MKVKKRKKSSRGRGSKTSGYGSRKKHRGKGHKGGKGKAGSGKRADQKKTYILKYEQPYFGVNAKLKNKKKKREDKINIGDIEKNLDSLEKNGKIELPGYKVLGGGEVRKKMKIKAYSFSKKAREKIEKAGGSFEEDNGEKNEKK